MDVPIPEYNLCRTLTWTSKELRDFIAANDATDKPLAIRHDPFESSRQWTGCFFGVATLPAGAHFLTYGIVLEILQGLFTYLLRGRRFREAVFEVKNDRFGTVRTVGVGKITPGRPDFNAIAET